MHRIDTGERASRKQGEGYNLDVWYLDVLRKYKDKLLCMTFNVLADVWFSKAKFVNEVCPVGIPRHHLRDDAVL